MVKVVIDQIFVGGISRLPPEGHPTGIFKQPVSGALALGREGLVGDAQADRRVHGGAEKALHQYAADNYPALAAAFPAIAGLLVAGSIGENLASRGADEESVCIGDVFRLGNARVQLSQPRSPCWKIDHKFGEPMLSRFIAERGLTGWYYRVLEAGSVQPGDCLELIERNRDPVTVARLWRVNRAHRPSSDELAACAATPGLAPGWVRKLSERLDWLRRNPEDGPRSREPL